MLRPRLFLAMAAMLLAVAAGPLPLASGLAGDEWPTVGGDGGKSHYSALTQINAETASRLGLAWSADLGTSRGMEATPVMVGRRLFLAGVGGSVHAFDAVSGRRLWTFEPVIRPKAYRTACCDAVNRGVAVRDGLVYVAALDGALYALDARTGSVRWHADTAEDADTGIASTGAPEIAGDVVVIGNSGAEYGTRGYVSAYDRRSGAFRWRFHVVPRDPALGAQDHPDLEPAVRTWSPGTRWSLGGGGAPWDAINFDPATGLVLVGTGNGGPYPREVRSPGGGDNLYLSSVVALDPKTGRVRWHYQETPGDSWDYTATQPMILTDIEIEGEQRPVLLHAPKNGFLYVIDRRDGHLLAAHRLVRTNWADSVDIATGRPHLTPQHSDYAAGPKIVFPATVGARNWQPGAFSAATGLYYASIVDMGNLMVQAPGPYEKQPRALNLFSTIIFGSDLKATIGALPPALRAQVEALPEMADVQAKPFVSELRAIDPLTGRTMWAHPMEGWQDRGGVLATAGGLVFQGTLSGALRVFDARNGRLLHSIETGGSIMAAPMTYRVGGVQYLAITTGWGGGGWPYVPRYAAAHRYGNANRLLVFRLNGRAVPLPTPLPPLEAAPELPAPQPWETAARIAAGENLFRAHCAICHANQPRSISPDLTRLPAEVHAMFDDIVRKGAIEAIGMPRWDDVLTKEQTDAIHAYLRDRQRKARVKDIDLLGRGEPLDGDAAGMVLAM